MTHDAASTTPAPVAVNVTAQYIKDFSFESPGAPQIFAALQTPPEISMGVNLNTRSVMPDHYEVLLTLKLDAKIGDKTAFIAELAYGGIFVLQGLPEEQLRYFLLVEAPRILFPFARNILMNAVRDGGFPHVMIAPIDFLGLYVANQKNVGTMFTAGAA